MENVIQGNKDIQVVFAHNDEMALGAAKAIKASNINAIIIIYSNRISSISYFS